MSDIDALIAAARDNFRWCWYVASRESRRVVPVGTQAFVQSLFVGTNLTGARVIEPVWMRLESYDGRRVHGELLFPPDEITGLHPGMKFSNQAEAISDWVLSCGEEVYGGWLLRLLYASAGDDTRGRLESIWGLAFDEPAKIPGLEPDFAESLAEKLGEVSVERLREAELEIGDVTMNMLHWECLCGCAETARHLVSRGLDPTERDSEGWSAFDYISVLGWEHIDLDA